MSTSDLIEVEKSSMVTIESHGHLHFNLGFITFESAVNDLKKSKDLLESNLKKEINLLAYPDGSYSDKIKDAAEELDKLLVTLSDNPGIIVELGSHTDSRGKDKYNLDLSQKRAEAAVEYLVENGIKHGISKLKNGGEISIKSFFKNEFLILEIINDGKYNPQIKNPNGTGLNNSKKRIELLYSIGISF